MTKVRPDLTKRIGKIGGRMTTTRAGAICSRFASDFGAAMVYIYADEAICCAAPSSIGAAEVLARDPGCVIGTWTAKHRSDRATEWDITEHIEAELLSRISARHARRLAA